MTKTAKTTRVTKGLQFRSAYADSNALWEVKKQLGDSVWLCEIVDEPLEINGKTYPSDYGGTQKSFLAREILGSIRWDATIEELYNHSDRFFDNLRLGAVCHYDNGFEQFVRCEVIEGIDPKDNRKKKLLQPFALVGKWQSHDLPRRNSDGTAYYPYHAEKIINHTGAWRPNYSCVFESPAYHKKGKLVPKDLQAIDLTLPNLTPNESKAADLVRLLNSVDNLASDSQRGTRRKLQQIYQLLTENKSKFEGKE